MNSSKVRSVRLLAGCLGLAAFFVAGPASALAADRFVDDTGTNAGDCSVEASPCATLQYAVDQASAGDAINVAAGDYPLTAAVTVNKQLAIRGAGEGATRVFRNSTTPAYAIDLQPNADGTEISDLTVDNAVAMASSGGIHIGTGGVFSPPATFAPAATDDVTLTRVTVDGFRYGVDAPNTGSMSGWTLDDLTVSGADLGLRLNGKVDDLTITDSTLEHNDQAISNQYSSSSQKLPGQFSNVTISDTSFDSNSTKGIYLESAQDVVIEGSSFVGTGTVACNRACADATPTNAIDINAKWADYSNVTIRDSVVADTDYVGSAAFGEPSAAIAIKARNDGSTYSPKPATLTNVDLENLVLTGNEEGAVDFGNAVTDATVTNSRIEDTDNGVALVSYTDSGTVDAENNWWGCQGGPGTAGCDANSGAVDVDPRLVVGLSASPSTVAPGGATSQVTADLSRNSDGDAAPGPLTSLDGLAVDFATDLGSVSPAAGTISGGGATTTFTSPAATGTANLTAAVDGQQGGAQITVANPPEPPADPDPGIVLPGPGPDTSGATDGPDELGGTDGDDEIDGLAGDDSIFGGLGDDLLTGGGGDDTLRGGKGDDEVRGGDGDDDIRGGAGDDTLRGGAGDDTIVGGGGEDDIGSGGGDDTIDAQDGERDVIKCGPGEDDLDADGEDEYGPNCENVS